MEIELHPFEATCLSSFLAANAEDFERHIKKNHYEVLAQSGALAVEVVEEIQAGIDSAIDEHSEE